jgi:hypothetical protein
VRRNARHASDRNFYDFRTRIDAIVTAALHWLLL